MDFGIWREALDIYGCHSATKPRGVTTGRLCCVSEGGFIMEAKREDQTCALKLKYVKGQTSAGKEVYAVVTFPHVNPEVSDGDVYEVAYLMGQLQARSVHAIVR